METLQRILVRVANFHRGLLLLFWLAFLPPHSFAQYMSRPISPSLMWRLDHNTELDRVLIIWILVMFTSKTRLVSPIYRREKERIQFPLATHIWRWMKSDREWISLGLGCMQERSDGTDWIREQSFQPLHHGKGMWMLHWVSEGKLTKDFAFVAHETTDLSAAAATTTTTNNTCRGLCNSRSSSVQQRESFPCCHSKG